MRAPKQTRLGSVHLPGDARRTHLRRSRHLPFYDPRVEGRQVTRVEDSRGQSGKNESARLLRSRHDPNVPRPEQTRKCETKFGRSQMNPVKEKRVKRWLCTVDRPSDRDHLFAREGEGCEEPFERDGTTVRSRGKKWHAWRYPVHAGNA
ncbi:hypothetical protein CRG98_036615 [Punica granatum]|uniref:Uncharacterized protein n=1 Tax=Punica granatum TaxID=22663 RepID=A0A2I0IH23_PUNGR|nr:hypothetical protein CRG98_036615 [Punica granatum]